MNRDELTATVILETEKGNRLELDYYIRTLFAGEEKIFALRVDKKEPSGGRLIETEASLPFSDNYENVRRMAQVFADGQVTPNVLTEMCDEWEDF